MKTILSEDEVHEAIDQYLRSMFTSTIDVNIETPLLEVEVEITTYVVETEEDILESLEKNS